MKKAIFLLGLPNAGKTTWVKENVNSTLYEMVSADDLKQRHPEYVPDDVTLSVHEWSVEQAEIKIGKLCQLQQNILVDSGSINNRYTIRIMTMLKKQGYEIKLVHIKTPYTVCIERNKLRDRKVPEKAITDKALKEVSQFHKLRVLVNEVEIVNYFTNKNIFVDMDGVIAAQSTLPIINGEIDFANGEIHKWQRPVLPVIGKLDYLKAKGYNLFILSATANSIAADEKKEWLRKHFPIRPEQVFFVNQGKHKAEMLDNLARKFKLNKSDVTLIDDFHQTLYDVKDRGMNAMHVSEFLTHEF
jgi:predicted kinase